MTDATAAPTVVLTNLGTPDAPTRGALRAYLGEFLSDPRIVDLPRPLWWAILNLIILNTRPRRSARLYASIWTDRGSPLLATTLDLAEAVEARLARNTGTRVPFRVAMRYGRPGMGTVLTDLVNRGVRRVLLAPLYPQYSATTTASTMDSVGATLRRMADQPAIRTIRSYPDDEGYLDALAASVREHWRQHGRGDHLVVSFHGLPQRYVDAGDPYPRECRMTALAMASRLALDDSAWSMCYQSRFGPGAWLSPATDERLRALARSGCSTVDVVCPGFAVDCLETLEEIAITGAEQFRDAGGDRLHYVPALNTRPDHCDAIASLILRELQGWIA